MCQDISRRRLHHHTTQLHSGLHSPTCRHICIIYMRNLIEMCFIVFLRLINKYFANSIFVDFLLVETIFKQFLMLFGTSHYDTTPKVFKFFIQKLSRNNLRNKAKQVILREYYTTCGASFVSSQRNLVEIAVCCIILSQNYLLRGNFARVFE